MDRIEKKLDDLATSVDEAFVEQRQYTEFAFSKLEAKMDAGFARMDVRFAGVDARFDSMDTRFDGMDARFTSLERKLDRFIKGFTAPKRGPRRR